MFASVLGASVLGRAIARGLVGVELADIRAYAQSKHKNTDDAPFGGGAGMVMLAQPVVDAVEAHTGPGFRGKKLYLSPRGRAFDQRMAEELAREPELLLLCGHYEGVDQRALDLAIDEEISIGDYVLTGGELGAMVLIDAVARLIPGVLGSGESARDESFTSGLLEYPQYTRPRVFHGLAVPEELLSGDHKKITRWRRERALELTHERRPDMLENAPLDGHDRAFLAGLMQHEQPTPTSPDMESPVRRALREYGLADANVHLIRHNENYTCRVESASRGEFVLRIHAPAPGLDPRSLAHTEPALSAEMRFVEALGEGTDIPFQRPVRLPSGEAVLRLPSGEGEGEGKAPVLATLLTWLPGRTFDPSADDAPEIAYKTGEMMAKMHDFTARWPEGKTLDRPRYDLARVEATVAQIEPGVQSGVLSERQFVIAKRAGEAIRVRMRELDARPDQCGLAHADLCAGNLIVCEGAVSPIDFCLSGHSYFYQDVGELIASLNDPLLRRRVLEGYRSLRALPEEDMAYVEAFFVMGILLFMGMHLNNVNVRGWFEKRLDRAIYKFFVPLIKDQRFYQGLLGA